MTEKHDFDPMDPHGFHADDAHHGHKIVSLRILGGVLAVLLAFTVLTVMASRVEVWAAEAFDVVIPGWVNIVVAMSIALVKGTLVLLYFMQLRYDNPLNSLIFLSCLFAFTLFLGLTAMDLGTRGKIHEWKSGTIVEGGNSIGLERSKLVKTPEGDEIAIKMVGGTPITEWAKEVKRTKLGGEEAFQDYLAHSGHGHHDKHSTADASRPRTGITPGLFDAEEPEHNDADHNEGDHEGEEEEAEH